MFELEVDDAYAPVIAVQPFVEDIEQDHATTFTEPPPPPDLFSAETPSPRRVSTPKPLFSTPCAQEQTTIPQGDGKVGWGLDRLDQRTGLDGIYHHGTNDGTGVDVYIVGSGIRPTHVDFQTATGNRITNQYTAVSGDGKGIIDCDGYGNRMASFAAGKYAGIAKNANIIPVKVWGCGHDFFVSDVVDGLKWILRQPRPRPAIVLAGIWYDHDEPKYRSAARDLVDAGFFVVAPTGHSYVYEVPSYGDSARSSPGNAPGVFTVASSTKADMDSNLTYMGSAISIFAPGDGVKAAGNNDDQEFNGSPGWYGPPYAAGYVTGAAALAAQWLVQQHPTTLPTVAEIKAALINASTPNVLSFNNYRSDDILPPRTVNRLLYIKDFQENFPVACNKPPDPGATSCDIDDIVPRGGVYSATGGSARIDIKAEAQCGWVASVEPSASWIHLRSCQNGGSGSVFGAGNAGVCFQIDPNITPLNPNDPKSVIPFRTGNIIVNQKKFFVNQNGVRPPECPVRSDGTPSFAINGPHSITPGQNLVLIAYPGAGFTYTWRSDSRMIAQNSTSPMIFLRPGNAAYPPANTPTTYYVRVTSPACTAGVEVSFSVTLSGPDPHCPLPVMVGPAIVASPGPGYRVGLSVDFPVGTFPTEIPTYQWYEGASGDDRKAISGETNDSYYPSPYVDSMYWVKITNSCGDVQLSGTGLVVVGIPPHIRPVRPNFTGLGKLDVLFRNPSSGANVLWAYDGGTQTGSVQLPSFDPAWQAQTISDLNADKRADIVWRNPVTGENAYWPMAGTLVLGTVPLESQDPSWTLAASADLADDGNMNLVWQNKSTNELQLWFMEKTQHIGSFSLGQLPSADWKLQGAADFDNDGKPDLMFRNYRTGANAIWHMEDTLPPGFTDTTASSAGMKPATTSLGGAVATSASGDGMPGTIIESLPDTNWRVASLADIDGDGRADIVWSNSASGELMFWKMYGTTRLNSVPMTPQTDPDLKVAGVPPVDLPPAPAPTTLTLTATPAMRNDTTSLIASLTSASAAVGGKNIVFAIDGNAAGSAVTGDDGTVTLVAPLDGLAIGAHAVTASFAGDSAYAAGSASTVVQISPLPPQIVWDNPAPIVYGTPLSDAQLNATADVAGTFTYSPPAGTVLPAGDQTLTATFTPSDPANGGAVTLSVTLTVNKAATSLTWPAPAAIVFGTPLSAAQLNAAANVSGSFVYDPPAGTILHAGSGQTLSVAFTPSDPNYLTATAAVTIDVAKAAQTISWPAPAAIVYGTPLSGAQLNATTSGGGTLLYTPPSGTILDAGDRQLTVNASETADYFAATASVTLHVAKATPVVAWATPAPIVYGTLLSSAQLNATANVAGTFTYSPVAGTQLDAGSHTLSVHFTPSDTSNYNEAGASVTINVAKAKQTITWAAPAPIVYGTPLSAAQLNASASVIGPAPAGALTYAPPAGTVLSAGTAQTLTVTAAATSNYDAATASVTIDVLKATPVVTWATPAPIVYGTPLSATQLNATANVAGTFTYLPALGTQLDAGTHTLSVHFTPSDAGNYNGADASVTIDVTKAQQTITWATPSAIVYGTPLSAAQLNATATVAGPAPAGALVYSPASGTMLDAGTRTLTVTAQETANYLSASSSVSIDVNRKPLSLVVDPKAKLYGAALQALTGTLTGVVNGDSITPSYATTATQASPAGTYPITATLIDPANRLGNYIVTITPSTLTIGPAPLLVSANAATKQYSDPIPQLGATFTGFVLGETPAVLGGTLSITTTATPLSAPGTYPIAIGGLTSPNYAIAYAGATLTVTQEDARVTITSPTLFSGTTVTLAATVTDITATASANGDFYPGDIRNPTLTFVDLATNAVLCTAPVGLADPSRLLYGVGTCSFTTTASSIVVGAKIGGYYLRDVETDGVTVTIVPPTSDAITGSASFDGAKANLNLKYDNDGAVKGNFTYTFNRIVNGVTYSMELTATMFDSLAIRRTADGGIASIVGSGVLRDVTKPSAPVVVVDGAPLVVIATDGGEPSAHDTLSVTLLKTDGGYWLAPVELAVTNGNITVH